MRSVHALVFGLALFLPAMASAGGQDLELWRLGDPRVDAAANSRFRTLSVDLGMALTPTPGHPAESLGRSGTAMNLGLRWADVHDGARVASEGDCPEGNPECRVWVVEDGDPAGGYTLPSLQVRKGLPLSFELQGQFQWVPDTGASVLSGGLRWALNEGFEYLPDLSVGVMGTRAVGLGDLGLTTVAVDVLVGKWFALDDQVQLAPYGGWQRVWVSGVSDVLDVDPFNEDVANPNTDDTVYEEVLLAENGHNRYVLGLRGQRHLLHVLVEAAWQPRFLDLADNFQVATLVGVAF